MTNVHVRAQEAANKFFAAEAELLAVVMELNRTRAYRELSQPSLFAYCVKVLKLTESTALNFINVARKSAHVPELKAEIDAGRLSVAKARKIVPVINREEAAVWIERATLLSSRELEREVARVAPQAATPETMKYVSASRVAVQLGLDEPTWRALKRVQDLESSRLGRAATLEDAVQAMTRAYLTKNDPVEKASRASHRPKKLHVPDMSTGTPGVRRPISARVLHAVQLRDSGRCAYVDERGVRCISQRWLHAHHRQPVAQGGGNTAENLELLCQGHHSLMHQTQRFK